MYSFYNLINLIKSFCYVFISNPVGVPFNNQSLINFLQSLIFPCGTYLGHLLQKFAKIESI
nr:MAG TPA: hypothetical protein [Caudoviricetes sp.]